MTHLEWDGCAEPAKMLACLRGRASDRKLLLFACACWRRWGEDLYRSGRGTRLLDGARDTERLADGRQPRRPLDEWTTMQLRHGPWEAARQTADYLLGRGGELGAPGPMARLLRDLFGNPFRPPCPLGASVRRWNGGAAERLAGAIYEGGRFEDLPVLADLLEEAGCCDADLLGHLRGPGPHAKGCWAVDLILNRT